LDAQNHDENGFAANCFELLAVVRGLVGATGAAILCGVNIEEPLNHLVAVQRGEQERRGFPRAHDQFSWAIRHGKFLAVRDCAARCNRKGLRCA